MSDQPELNDPLRRAVEHIRGETPPRESVMRALDRARQAPASPRPTRRLPRALLAVAALAAAVLIALGVWLLWPGDSWADVAKAIGGKPWVHATGKVGDQTGEIWFSPTHQLSASKSPDHVMFYDQRLRILHSYSSEEKVLYRVPDAFDSRQREFQAFQETLQSLFRGEVGEKSPLGYGEVLERKKRDVTEDGKKWQEHVFLVRMGQNDEGPKGRLVFRVDPDSHLPRTLTISPLKPGSDEPQETLTMTFDYPEKGPADIHDLGVPRDAKLVDRVPADDLNRVLAGVKAGRERLQPYRGVAVEGYDDNKDDWWIGHPHLIWHNGLKWRVEGPSGPVGGGKKPAGEPDQATWWWKEAQAGKWQLFEFCDGKAAHDIEFGAPDAQGKQKTTVKLKRRLPGDATVGDSIHAARYLSAFPEHFGYPGLPVPSEQFEAKLDAKPKDGPAGTVLLTVQMTNTRGFGNAPAVYKDLRYWIDPNRGYVTMRQEMRLKLPGEEGADDPKACMLVELVTEKLERSPNGVWYPAVVAQTTWTPQQKSEKTHRYFLDFKKELPDTLFTGAER